MKELAIAIFAAVAGFCCIEYVSTDDPTDDPTDGPPHKPPVLTVECPCPEDITGDGIVGVDDLMEVLAQWGEETIVPLKPEPCPNRNLRADVNMTYCVDLYDLLDVVRAWGACE